MKSRRRVNSSVRFFRCIYMKGSSIMRGTLSLSVIVILLLPIVASADWVMISLESAVNSSDLIVIGTLRNVSEETRKGFDYGMGEIKIDEVLSGNAEPGQTLSLV